MNLSNTIEMHFTGTTEGAEKAWDTRGRGPKLKWRAAEAPTGRYRSFSQRGWPSADYPDGRIAVHLYSKDAYVPSRVKTGEHAPISVRIADHSQKPWQWRKINREFKTLEEAKTAAHYVLTKVAPHFVPSEFQDSKSHTTESK